MKKNTVFKAKKILTMNDYLPEATHVAVREGRILGVGSEAEMKMWGAYELDERFARHVLTPGFVEGHAHAEEGNAWEQTYVGYHDRYDPEGRLWYGVDSLDAVAAVLKKIEAVMEDPQEPLFAWGFDPIFFAGERMSTRHLDRVSTTRPILVLHSNGHLLNVNGKVLSMAGITAQTNVHGISKDEQGQPTGELVEMAAMYMAYKYTGDPFFDSISTRQLNRYAQAAVNCGVTTATDLWARYDDDAMAVFAEATSNPGYPLRLVPALNTLDVALDKGIKLARESLNKGNDKLYYGLCKIMTDGSIQGFSGRLKWPGYLNGAPNGLWNLPPEQLTEMVQAYHAAGLQLHIHTNGDEASELMIDAIEQAIIAFPRPDHRHTLQHCQMADAAQFRRMAALGICVNLFANHIYYWGDQHYAITLGPDRASRLNACRSAIDSGVSFSIHSDAPVTPLAPLFTAWCAVNRLTTSGKLLGPLQRIGVKDALWAITQGAAYTLKMDHLVGSIEPGKFADFAVLEEDPTAVSATSLKDIGVWGTITGGVAQPASTRQVA
jgi:predicted amidohydrolase YtcJ